MEPRKSLALACAYFDAGRCRSCTLLDTAYSAQLAAKDARVRELLDGHDAIVWESPVASETAGFRTKAKMVVGGTADAATLGILDAEARGVDLRDCGIVAPAIRAAFPALAAFIARAALTPYDVAARRGELKHLIVTASPDEELMVRFVLRSSEPVARIRKHLGSLLAALPRLLVVTVNLLPEHAARLEGDDELVLTEADALPVRLGDVTLEVLPRSFVQTNTGIARRLYATARDWVNELAPAGLWDLYCGVGGFALHCAAPERRVLGVELSADAVASAERAAAAAGVTASFIAADATAFALGSAQPPELVIVNPPRRGIGETLAEWLEASAVRSVLYSSCNAESLARDLASMPSLRPRRAQLFDMFPHTAHSETLVLLER